MPDESVVGVNYFDHQFLRREDFEAERRYHEDRLRQHDRLLHSAGVVAGLNVSGSPGAKEIQITVGTALDSYGREVLLKAATAPDARPLLRRQVASGFEESEPTVAATGLTINIGGIPGAPQPLFVTIRQGTKPTEPSRDPGLTGNTRLVERAVIEVSPVAASGAQLLLATINRTADGSIQSVSMTRPQAGALLADRSVTESKLANSSVSGRALQDGAVTLDKLAIEVIDGGDVNLKAATATSTFPEERLVEQGIRLESRVALYLPSIKIKKVTGVGNADVESVIFYRQSATTGPDVFIRLVNRGTALVEVNWKVVAWRA